MLNSFRKSAKSPFAKIIYTLIAASFIVWGVDFTAFSFGGTNHPAEVDDRPVTVQQVDRAFQGQVAQLRQSFGAGFTTEQAVQFGILDNTVQRLISDALLQNAALDLGVGVDEDSVRQAIFDDPSFRNQAGVFDRDRFTQILAQNRYTEAAYVEELKAQLMRNQLIDALVQGVTVPERLSQPIAAHRAEQRKGRYLTVTADSVPDISEPTEEQLAAFHKEFPVRFTAPEYRTMTMVAITAAELAKTIELTQEEILAAYEESIDSYRTPETRVLRHMLFSADRELDAAKAANRLEAGEDFDAVAMELTGMTREMTELGELSREDTLANIREEAFALPEGGTTRNLRSGFGWHVVKVEKVNAAMTQPLTAVGDELAQQLKLNRAADEIFSITGAFEDQLGGGATLAQAAAEFGLEAVTVTVDQSGNGTDGQPVTLPVADAVGAAFALEDGEEGQMTEFGNGDYFIVKVDSVTPSALKPMADVRADVDAAWRANARAEKAKEIAEGIAKESSDLTKLAEAAGYPLTETAAVTRDGGGAAELPSSVVGALFDLDPNMRSTVAVTGGHAVVLLEEVIHAPASGDAAQSIAAAFRQDLAGDLIAAYGTTLRAEADVLVNNTLLQSMYAPADARYRVGPDFAPFT